MLALIEKQFKKKLNMERLEKHLLSIKNVCKVYGPVEKEIRVACVQRKIRLTGSLEAYIDRLHWFVKGAALQNSQIIVFPEYNFLDLLGMIPTMRLINPIMRLMPQKNAEPVGSKNNDRLNEILLFLADSIPEVMETIMSRLAQKYGIYIYSGTYPVKEMGKLYNSGTLIDREGKVLTRQRKLHLTDFEEAIGFKRDTCMETVKLDIGRAACPICMDASYYETFMIAKVQRCDFVILPIANMEEYSMYKALRGIWSRVQESYVYGLKASLNGWLLGLHFTGKAGIFAPLELTKEKNGVVVVTPHHEGDYLVTTSIALEELENKRKHAEYHGDINQDFEKNYSYKNLSKLLVLKR